MRTCRRKGLKGPKTKMLADLKDSRILACPTFRVQQAEILTNLEEDVNADVAEEAIPSFPSDTYSAGEKHMDELNFPKRCIDWVRPPPVIVADEGSVRSPPTKHE